MLFIHAFQCLSFVSWPVLPSVFFFWLMYTDMVLLQCLVEWLTKKENFHLSFVHKHYLKLNITNEFWHVFYQLCFIKLTCWPVQFIEVVLTVTFYRVERYSQAERHTVYMSLWWEFLMMNVSMIHVFIKNAKGMTMDISLVITCSSVNNSEVTV